MDVLANRGNNVWHWKSAMMAPEFTQPNDPAISGGVRILHVDQRLAYPAAGKSEAQWFDPSKATDYNNKSGTTSGAVSAARPASANSMSIGIATKYSPDPDNAFYFNLHTMTRSGKDPLFTSRVCNRGYFDLCACDLFVPGTSFSMESHASAFANAPYMNNHGTFDYEITVVSYNSKKAEAVVTVRRISAPAPVPIGSAVFKAGTTVRRAPDNSSVVVTKLKRQTTLDYTDIENGWYHVILEDGSDGYIHHSMIVKR